LKDFQEHVVTKYGKIGFHQINNWTKKVSSCVFIIYIQHVRSLFGSYSIFDLISYL
jgi:hypothetical protein